MQNNRFYIKSHKTKTSKSSYIHVIYLIEAIVKTEDTFFS